MDFKATHMVIRSFNGTGGCQMKQRDEVMVEQVDEGFKVMKEGEQPCWISAERLPTLLVELEN